MLEANTDIFEAGKIVGVHGLRGDLKVFPHSKEPDALLAARQVQLSVTGQPATVYPVANSRLHKGRVLLRLQGLEHISKVEHLVGAQVFLTYDQLPQLAEGEHYWYQIEGMSVVDKTLGLLGTLQGYFTTAAHDTWVIQGPFGEVMMPAVEAFICDIDESQQTIHVDLPEGLVEPDDL